MLNLISHQLEVWKMVDPWLSRLSLTLFLIIVAVVCTAVHKVLCKVLLNLIHRAIKRSKNTWDDALMETGFFKRLLRLIPLFLALIWIDYTSSDGFSMLKRMLFSAIVLVVARGIEMLLNAVSNVYHRQSESGVGRKPIRPLIQVVIIIVYLLAFIFVIGLLVNKSPWKLVSLMGGLTAVTMLVFKDTILGFVAGIQLGANDMVREGDWIEMPKYGADGDVIEVAVHTVKVRNWDKTVTTIPTYALISDSFKNWRGMSESGGRRIKRSVFIDMNTVRFVDTEMLESFRKMDFLKEYLEERQREIDQDNREREINLDATIVNGRRQTNLGIFRAYLAEYLHHHPKINQEMTFLVRHLQPTPQGLPIEVYVFSSDKAWANYESIQADIFDHILASVSEFGLRVFQQPSGADVTSLVKTIQ